LLKFILMVLIVFQQEIKTDTMQKQILYINY